MPTQVLDPSEPLNVQFARSLYIALAADPSKPFASLSGEAQARFLNLADQTLRHISYNLAALISAFKAHNKAAYNMIEPPLPPITPAPTTWPTPPSSVA